jgi:RNA polymerase-interacting CarD/CdnL/TRCF family regulator
MKLLDYVYYAGHGLGQITEVKVMHEVEFFSIQILDSALKIFIPKSSSSELLRPLMDRDTAKRCQLYIREPSEYMPEHKTQRSWKRRFDGLLSKLKSNNPISVAEVIAELQTRKFDGEELNFGERKMLDAALALIQPEIDLVLK